MRKLKLEKIICSAIWYKDFPLLKPEVLKIRGFAPINVDRGIVLAGLRHANCLYQMVAILNKADYQVGESIQGFLTNKNRFVDRKEALTIALNAKQVNEKQLHNPLVGLFSEDLY